MHACWTSAHFPPKFSQTCIVHPGVLPAFLKNSGDWCFSAHPTPIPKLPHVISGMLLFFILLTPADASAVTVNMWRYYAIGLSTSVLSTPAGSSCLSFLSFPTFPSSAVWYPLLAASAKVWTPGYFCMQSMCSITELCCVTCTTSMWER